MPFSALTGRRAWQNILNRLFGRQHARARHKPLARFLPVVELMEDRLAPAVFVVSSSQQLIDAIATADGSIDSSNVISMAAGTYVVGDQLISAVSSHTLVIAGPATSPPSVTITASGASRVFQIDANVTFENINITGGLAKDGGQVGGTAALGGGVLIDGGNVVLSNVALTGNQAVGADGSQGAVGTHPGGNGKFGHDGANAFGGGIYLARGSLVIKGSLIDSNVAQGGAGGTGGAGIRGSDGANKLGQHGATGGTGTRGRTGGACSNGLPGAPGKSGKAGGAGSAGQNGGAGGAGGDGGEARGGGIYVAAGNVTLIDSSMTSDRAVGGQGGQGGAGARGGDAAGTGGTGGFGGNGGRGGNGGHATKATQGHSINGGSGGVGGNGGVGGKGGDGGSGGAGGAGGSGGTGKGGGMYIATGSVFLANSTIATATAASNGGGAGGAGGSGGAGANGGVGGTGGFGGDGGDAGAPLNATFAGLSFGGQGGNAGPGGDGGAGGNGGNGGKGGAGGAGGDTTGGAVFVEDSAFFTVRDDSTVGGTALASPGGAGGAGGAGNATVGQPGAGGPAGLLGGFGGNPGGADGGGNSPGIAGAAGNPGSTGATGSTGSDGANTDDNVSGRQFSASTPAPPTVSPNTVSLPANALTLAIGGSGFSSTPADNTVTLSGGAAGIVIGATSSLLTVGALTGLKVGPLTAIVTTGGQSSGSAVQVATVIPVVTPSAASLGVTATSMIIRGFGFDTTPGNDAVSFSGGVTGTVTAATPNQLIVTSLSPLTAGPLLASVTVDSQSNGRAVQVATVTASITPSTANLAANATTLVIQGAGFSAVATSDIVKFSGGATGKVTGATTTQLTISGLTGLVAGPLTATVTIAGLTTALTQVANVLPVVTSGTAILAANAASLTIHGFGFAKTAAGNTVTLSGGATGTVSMATATTLTVSGLKGLAAGSLTATVSSNTVSSGSPVAVATVIPVVTKSTAPIGDDATGMTINGFGFDASSPGNNLVSFGGGVKGIVSVATPTQLTVTGLSGIVLGSKLTASITVDGQSSGPPLQVATVTASITANGNTLPATATAVIIQGTGFAPTPAGNTVTFSGGATGKVTSATTTQLTVTGLTGLVGGALFASVTAGGLTSAPVQVATVVPVVTGSSVNLAANATTVTIAGFGFAKTPGNNTVQFSGGATGKVTSATATTLTVTSLTGLAHAGSLTATVTTNSVGSAGPVQIATLIPVVTKTTASLGGNATTLVISGFGFDTTASNDTVVLSGGATGTVTGATANQLTLTGLHGLAFGPLTASVTVDGHTSAAPVQVATVTSAITSSTQTLAANATTLIITGFGFSSAAANNMVRFSGGATGIVTKATPTQLTVTGLSGLVAGPLSATVTVGGLTSAPVQVATVQPVVTVSTTKLRGNATSLTIHGFGFSKIAGNNTVTFSGRAKGKVTAATATTLTVTGLSGLTAGTLTVIVTSNGITSAAAVQVATVAPA